MKSKKKTHSEALKYFIFCLTTGLDKQNFSAKTYPSVLTCFGFSKDLSRNKKIIFLIFSYPSVLTYVLGAQKNCLIETVLLSTHNIHVCFG